MQKKVAEIIDCRMTVTQRVVASMTQTLMYFKLIILLLIASVLQFGTMIGT